MASIDQFERKLDEALTQVEGAKRNTIIIFVVLIAIVGGYMFWLSGQVKMMTDQKALSDIAINQVNTMIPQVRAEIANTLKAEAPKMLEEAVKEIVNQIPEARKYAEKWVQDQVNAQADRIEKEVDQQVQMALSQHKGEFGMLLRDLKTDEGRRMFENALFDAMGEMFQDPQMQADLESYGLFLVRVHKKLERLFTVPAEQLSPAERLEKELIQTIRAISLRTPKYEEKIQAETAEMRKQLEEK